MKKLTALLTAFCLALVLTACTDTEANSPPADAGFMQASASDVLLPEYGPLPAYPPEAEGVHLVGVRLPEVSLNKIDHPEVLSTVPVDSHQFYEDMRTVSLSRDSGVAGWLYEPVRIRNAEGYPIYSALCTFSDHRSICTLAEGQSTTEQYLADHVTLVRNVDVLRNDWNCQAVCVDSQGRVLGKVSPEMIQWREKRCLWTDYGTAKCH